MTSGKQSKIYMEAQTSQRSLNHGLEVILSVSQHLISNKVYHEALIKIQNKIIKHYCIGS